MNEDDLKFVIAADLDPSEVEKALNALAQKTDDVSKGFKGSMLDALSKFAKEADKLDFGKLSSGMKANEAALKGITVEELNRRKKVYEEIAEIISKQREDTEEIRHATTPELMRARYVAEQEILKVKHEQSVAEASMRLDPVAIADELKREKELLKIAEQRMEVVSKERAKQTSEAEKFAAFQKEATKEYERQGDELLKIRALSDPAMVSKRVTYERNIAKARERQEELVADEHERQGAGDKFDIGKEFKKMFSGGGGGGFLAALVGGQGGGGFLGQIGGILGGSIGGATGAAIGSKLMNMIPKAIEAPIAAVNAGLSTMDGALRKIGSQLGPVGAVLGVTEDFLNGMADFVGEIPIVGEVLGPLMKQFAAMPALLGSILDTLVSFSQKASPGIYHMYQLALEDTQATIGRSFLSLLVLMRDYTRGVGDAIANLLPTYAQVESAISEVKAAFADAADSMREAMTELGPIVREGLTIALRNLGTVMSEVFGAVSYLYRGLAALTRPIRELIGLSAELQTSVGAAAHPANIGGIDEYQRQLQISAYSSGSTGMSQLPSTVSEIRTILVTISEYLSILTPANIAAAIRGNISSTATGAANAAQAAAAGLGSGLFGGTPSLTIG